MKEQIREQADRICKVLYDKKADDILLIDIADKSVLADYFVICSGRSSTLIKTLADEVEEKMGEAGMELKRKEGYTEARWIVLDYGDILVHIFHPDERRYYNMERLWQDDTNARTYPFDGEN